MLLLIFFLTHTVWQKYLSEEQRIGRGSCLQEASRPVGEHEDECDKGHEKGDIKCLEARRGKDASGLMAKVASELGFEAREAAKEQTGREGKTGGCTWGAQGRDSRSPMGLKDVWAVSFVTLTLSLPLSGSQWDMSTHPRERSKRDR